ncbi:putative DNA methylase [Candidatus Saccharimonas aalborgensis]|uniref:Putative DNA methylase n=1 Tax=Candidatus Saccharimonas aalborgensis TaxID=1332188 RepID=R4PKU5_9BACT|nr:site-specific DNA-methyltransferase [Candidatus Saccharimonas aalborgensis]AGL62178.1 putative DNA methylase [Candidatus Saccharimonas aalborgensis]
MAQKGRYTELPNKIGLYSTSRGSFIKNDNDVVLSFPFKDTVLEAGMSKEDVGRDERFLHQELDTKDIDTLEEPKVLTDFRYVDKDGERPLTASSDVSFFDDDGNLTQNLLIKGNNLLALYTLREKLAGKVKFIYIDPPYNTRTDANTFAYNNNFNHSSWLTFMRNRLEVAKELLTEDGMIFIDIDHYELFYLGVLADEIFGFENRIGVLAVVNNLGGRFNKFFSQAHENKIVYAKNAEKAEIKELVLDNSDRFQLEDELGRYKRRALQRSGDGSLREDRPTMFYPIFYNPDTQDITTSKPSSDGYVEILPIDTNGVERRWRWGKAMVEEKWQTEIEARKVDSEYRLFTKDRMKGEKPKTVWFKPEYSGASGTGSLKDLLGEKAFSYPKAVALVKDSIQISTEPNDIVLDFFGGSGTTAQAVMAQNAEDGGSRKFILIEQMNYVNNVTFKRLENAIKKYYGDTSFVYFELKKYNQEYLDAIMEATSIKELEDLYVDMRNNAFLKFWFDRAEFEKDENFRNKDLDGRKQALADILDENQLYLNYADMNDTRHTVSADEKALTDKFYGENEN